VPLFKSRALPATSYGYLPPPAATAHGWECSSDDCGNSANEPVRRWPKSCSLCGSPADPLFDEPWAHDAKGLQLQWVISHRPAGLASYYEARWQVWQFTDALRRGDREAAQHARHNAHTYALEHLRCDSSFSPGDIFFSLVWRELEIPDLDWAAEDLTLWLTLSIRHALAVDRNSRQVIHIVGKFLDAGGTSHPEFGEIRTASMTVAEHSFQILSSDLQGIIHRVAGT